MKRMFAMIQNLGRSLMLPIAVLPIAGLLLRLGQPDLLELPYVAAAGNAVFAHLGLLFAIGVAVGLARESNGAAGLAAVVAYLVTTEGAKVLIDVPPDLIDGVTADIVTLLSDDYRADAIARLSVPAGLLSGILAGALYNRYSAIRLPEYLAFFAGRRFVPIVSGFAALLLAAAFGFGWPVLQGGMDALSRTITGAGEVGLFAYGVLNRVLIVTGLHHILNNIAWFIVGDFGGVTGDLRRYFAGDPAAGAFMSGFFPVMMFGLPAACLAMYRSADRGRRAAVGGLLLSMGLTSFLTGITEPIEFTFMFVAPVLYAIHAVLTGVSMVLMDLLNVRLGFGFSAGLFDYVLNFNRATRPWLLVPVGLLYFAVYYLTFRYFILWKNVRTPGRGVEDQAPAGVAGQGADESTALIAALGGAGNLLEIGACTTRLRLTVSDAARVDEAALKALGAAGILWVGAEQVQVVVGLRADEIAAGMRARAQHIGNEVHDRAPAPRATAQNVGAATGIDVSALLAAVGGPTNVVDIDSAGTRLLLTLGDAGAVNEPAVLAAGLRGTALIDKQRVQILGNGAMQDVGENFRARVAGA